MAEMRFLSLVIALLVCLPLVAQQGGLRPALEKFDADLTGSQAASGYVFDITVQNVDQLDAILNRAEMLRGQFSAQQHGRIALILHGNELNLFRKKNYRQFMMIVDRARLLDEQQLVDIKACQTAMSSLHIQQSELPDFIEQVPLAPLEIERLVKQKGYTRL